MPCIHRSRPRVVTRHAQDAVTISPHNSRPCDRTLTAEEGTLLQCPNVEVYPSQYLQLGMGYGIVSCYGSIAFFAPPQNDAESAGRHVAVSALSWMLPCTSPSCSQLWHRSGCFPGRFLVALCQTIRVEYSTKYPWCRDQVHKRLEGLWCHGSKLHCTWSADSWLR